MRFPQIKVHGRPRGPGPVHVARASILAAVLVLVGSLAGCLGGASGPGIPQSDLSAKQWGRDGEPSTRTLYGLAEIRQQAYGPGGTGKFGGALVVSVTDVPLVDEEDHVPEQVAAYERSQGITLRKTGTETMTLSNVGGLKAAADLYDVETSAAGVGAAKAVILQVHCEEPDVFVVAVGYGATATSAGGPLGLPGGGSVDVYDQARGLVQALDCQL